MSRHGYSDDGDYEYVWLYMNAVERSLRGKRGQALLREMIVALDAMPEKRLVENILVGTEENLAPEDKELVGQVCAMGAVIKARGLSVSGIEQDNPEEVASLVGLAPSMVREIAYQNDEEGPYRGGYKETPEQRWTRMRAWAERQLIEWTEIPS